MKQGEIYGLTSAVLILLMIVAFISSFWFSLGWDTGLMEGKIIGYDTRMFGTKAVFVLEERGVFTDRGISQSQIVLCSDYDDYEIHKLIEDNIGKDVIVEYQERRVGFYPMRYCHEAPITAIKVQP